MSSNNYRFRSINLTSDSVINKSNVSGTTVTDALNTLDAGQIVNPFLGRVQLMNTVVADGTTPILGSLNVVVAEAGIINVRVSGQIQITSVGGSQVVQTEIFIDNVINIAARRQYAFVDSVGTVSYTLNTPQDTELFAPISAGAHTIEWRVVLATVPANNQFTMSLANSAWMSAFLYQT